MPATSRALAALTLTAAVLLPAAPVGALSHEDPAPASTAGRAAGLTASTPSGTRARILVDPRSEAVQKPGIAADSWLVADLDTGQILASQNADLEVRPASTLKLLTALTVAPRLAPEQPYRAVKADEEAEGNRVVLYRGLPYTVADLLHAALLPSANDAAEALARANGGVELTVEQMNAEAARLGAASTRAVNPSGLDADGQVTTARDMAVLGRAAFANPEIAGYLKLRLVDFPGKVENGKRVIYPIYNHNRMLVYPQFEGAMGGKSGYTSLAGNTLVAAAERDGRRLLVTLFRIGGNTYRSGEVLLDWGFANLANLEPIGQLPEPATPAPQFDRAIIPLPAENAAAAPPMEPGGTRAADEPSAQREGSGHPMPSLSAPGSTLTTLLTVLTLLMGVLVVLRGRVYWVSHRRWAARAGRESGARPETRLAGRSRSAGHGRSARQSQGAPTSGARSQEDLVGSRR